MEGVSPAFNQRQRCFSGVRIGFSHARATDRENNAKLLKLTKNTPAGKRGATFVCVIAIAEGGNLLGVSEGKCSGRIGFEPKGKNGFGYDPLFMPKGYKKTFAELKPGVKNTISHRARALKGAKPIVRKYL